MLKRRKIEMLWPVACSYGTKPCECRPSAARTRGGLTSIRPASRGPKGASASGGSKGASVEGAPAHWIATHGWWLADTQTRGQWIEWSDWGLHADAPVETVWLVAPV
jgi:hypothetical protein